MVTIAGGIVLAALVLWALARVWPFLGLMLFAAGGAALSVALVLYAASVATG